MEYAFRSTLTRVLVVLAVLAAFTGALWAQGGTGELTGLVSDATGAVVSNAPVTLTNSATGDRRAATTSSAGTYRFAALPVVGAYSLEVTAQGFKRFEVANIIISVGVVTTRDVKLEVGAQGETVTVEAGAQLVNTEDSSTSQLVDRRVWEKMPLETRSQNEFINLVAGAIPEKFDETFRGASVNGTRSGTGNYMVEGVDNNEQGQGGVTIGAGQGGANTSISPDAIEEYRVITHDFNAEYGKAGGFVTDTVLKSGTNKWHGSLFEYNRIQALTANDFFSNRAQVKDHLVRNQFGGSLGGPIVKDKTFFFATVELHRLRVSTPTTATSFTQQFYDFVNTGAFQQFMEGTGPYAGQPGWCDQVFGSACPGAFGPTTNSLGQAVTGSSTVGPIFKSQLAKFPLAVPLVNSSIDCSTFSSGANANCFGEGIYSGQALFGLGPKIQYPVPLYDTATEEQITPLDQYRVSLKVDHKFSSKDQFSGTYLLEDAHNKSNFGLGDATFGVPEENPNRAQTLGLVYTHSFSPIVLNQLRGGYVRRTANFTSPGTDGIPSMITIDALGGGFGASTAIPQFFTENEFQYKDDISITKGKHGLKFGAEYRRTRNGSSFDADKNGHFWSWGGEDLITDSQFSDQAEQLYIGYPYFGTWYSAAAAVNPTNGQLPVFYRGYRSNEMAFYSQDAWRVTPRLTLNLGLRWEYFGPPHNFQSGLDSNFFFGPATTPIATTSNNPFFPISSPFYAREATGSFKQVNSNIWNKDKNNFGPRVGFAWDAMGNQKLVVRAGGGIFYDRLYNNAFENIRFNPPAYCDCTIGILQNGAAAGALATPGLLGVPFTATSAFAGVGTKARPRHIDEHLVTAYYEQWNFGLEYELGKDLALEANYIGTMGHKLLGIMNLNTFDGRTSCNGPQAPGSPCDLAGFPNGYSTRRPNTKIGSDNFRTNAFSSNYNGVNLTLRKRFSAGLQFNANYTFSKALDQISDVFRAKGDTSPTDPMNIHLDYGPSDFDVRHRFVTSLNYDLPFLKRNRWLGGWSTNAIFSWQTGASIALFDGSNSPNGTGNVNERPNFVGTGSVTSALTGGNPAGPASGVGDGFLKAADFAPVSCPASVNGGIWCNSTLGRGSLHGPHFVSLDFGLDKAFKITEGTSLTFLANFFDIANHPNFQNPNGNVIDPNFGRSQSTFGDAGGHRVTQLALRFDF